MTLSIDNVLVFRTNIMTNDDHDRLRSLFDTYDGIDDWSIDREDIDCVLRVVSNRISAKMIIEQITNIGYNCSELE